MFEVLAKNVAKTMEEVSPEELDNLNKNLSAFKGDLSNIIAIIIAFALVTSVLVLIIHFIRLQGSSNNSMARNQVLKDIGVVAISVALLGSVGLIAGILISSFI